MIPIHYIITINRIISISCHISSLLKFVVILFLSGLQQGAVVLSVVEPESLGEGELSSMGDSGCAAALSVETSLLESGCLRV